MHLIYILSLFNEKPINTEVTVVSSDISEFPSITICRTFTFLGETSFLKNLNLPLEKFEKRTLNDFIKILYSYTNTVFFVIQNQKYLKSLESIRRSEWRRIFYALNFNLTIEIPDILVFCEFNGLKCDFTHFKKHDNPNYYNCFTFDTENFRKTHFLAFSSNQINFQIIVNTLKGVGNADQGAQALAIDSVFQLEIHPPGTRPSLSENLILESSERLLQIDVKRSEHNKMYLEKRPCFQNLVGQTYGYETVAPLTNFSDPNYYITSFSEKYPNFTRNDCINDEWQNIYLQKCGCFSPLLPLSRYVIDKARKTFNSISWCTDSKMMTEFSKIYNVYYNYTLKFAEIKYFFYYITKDGKVGNIGDELNGTKPMETMECLIRNINKKENLETVNKLCPFFCNQVTYDIEPKFLKWVLTYENNASLYKYLAKEAAIVKTTLNQSSLWSNYQLDPLFLTSGSRLLSYINVIYDLSKKSIISEHETYPLINLSSDIGGILGVWVGVSILVVAEFIVICKTIFTSCKEKDKNEVKKEREEHVQLNRSELLSLFLSTTSFHGINHLVATKNVYYRIFWASVLLLSFAGLTANIEKVVSLFLSTPISIEMKYNLDIEEYPAISFCPSTIVSYNQVKISNNFINKNNSLPYFQLINDYIEPIWTGLYEFQQMRFKNNVNKEIFFDSSSQYLRDASIKHSLMKYLMNSNISYVTRKEAFNLVFACEFSFEKCSFNNFQLQYHPVYKICFTFKNSETNQRLGYPEYLSLLLLSNDINSTMLYNSSATSLYRGGIYEIHPYKTLPTMKRSHPFTHATRQIITITKAIDKIMNSDVYPCFDNYDDLITLIEEDIAFSGIPREMKYKYSMDLCEQLAIQTQVFKLCKCVSSTLPLSKEQNSTFKQPHKCAELETEIYSSKFRIVRQNNNFSTILFNNNSMSLDSFINSFKWSTQFFSEFDCHSKVMSNSSIKVDAIRQCIHQCNKVTYSIRISENKSPFVYDKTQIVNVYNEYFLNLNVINQTNSSIISSYVGNYIDTEKVFDYLSGFHFFFPTSEAKVITQSEGYSLIGMISDLGGVLGLWFGISVATLFELIEIIILIVFVRN